NEMTYGPPPFCPEGVPEGTPIDTLLTVGCHGGYRTPQDIHFQFSIAENDTRVVAVVRPDEPMDERAEYAVLFALGFPNGAWGYVIEVGDDGIVAIDSGCAFAPEQMWQRLATSEAVLAPAG